MPPPANAIRPIFYSSNRKDDSVAESKSRRRLRSDLRPLYFLHGFLKATDSAVFADSAAPSRRPIFCRMNAKVDDSADSATVDCIMTPDPMPLPFRPIFCGSRKTRPHLLSYFQTPPTPPTPQRRRRVLFFATHSCGSTTPPRSRRPRWIYCCVVIAQHDVLDLRPCAKRVVWKPKCANPLVCGASARCTREPISQPLESANPFV